MLWYSVSTLEVDLAAVGSVPPCRKAPKKEGNTHSQDTATFFVRRELRQEASPEVTWARLCCARSGPSCPAGPCS